MKTIIFVRGVESPFKRSLVGQLMQVLNPDVNTIRAIKLGMAQFLERPQDKGALKAADKSVKNILKKILVNHAETYILIDNETTLPVHWRSFSALAEELRVEIAVWGIDIPEVAKSPADEKRVNFYNANSSTFNFESTKYWLVNIDQPDEVLRKVRESI